MQQTLHVKIVDMKSDNAKLYTLVSAHKGKNKGKYIGVEHLIGNIP